MKTLSFFCGLIMLITTSSGLNAKKVRRHQTMATITLTAVPIHTPPAGYHIVLTSASNPSKHYTAGFPPSGGTNTTTVPAGIYTASIIPTGGAGSTHNFHAQDCVNVFNTTGTQASWSNLDFTCGSASFSIN